MLITYVWSLLLPVRLGGVAMGFVGFVCLMMDDGSGIAFYPLFVTPAEVLFLSSRVNTSS